MKAGERSDHPVELLSASIDRELRPAEAAALEAHLEGCAECRGLLGDFRRLDDAIASEAPPPIPAGLEQRILSALKSRPAAPSRALWKQMMPAAAAASLVVAIAVWFARPDRLPPLTGEVPAPAVSDAAPPPTPVLRTPAPTRADEPSPVSGGPASAPAGPATEPAGPAPAKPTPPAPENASALPLPRRLAEDMAAIEPPSAAGKAASAEGSWTVESQAGSPAEAEKKLQAEAAAAQAKDLAMERRESAAAPAAAYPHPAVVGRPAQDAAPGMKAVAMSIPRPVGVFAPPYVVTLESAGRMQVHRGTYNCTVPIEESDGKVVAAALDEILGPSEERSRVTSRDSAAATVVTASPQARATILRLVRETYRPALESRCGPLPN